MAIFFRCKCGKKLQTQDQFAGRQLNCPACTQIMTIPVPHHDALVAGNGTTANGQDGRRVDFVRFACNCGKKMKAHRSDAGSMIECPACGVEREIPRHNPLPPRPAVQLAPKTPWPAAATPTPTTATEPTPATTPETGASPMMPVARGNPGPLIASDSLVGQRITPWADDETQGLSGPPPRERRVKALPWLLLLLLLAAGLVVAEWYIAPRTRAGGSTSVDVQELTLLPADTVELVTIRIGSLLEYPQLGEHSAAVRWARNLVNGLGLAENELERVTLGWMPGERDAPRQPDPIPAEKEKQQKKAPAKGGGKKGKEKEKEKAPPAAEAQLLQQDWAWCVLIHMRRPINEKAVVLAGLDGADEEKTTPHAFYKRSYFKSAKGDKAIHFASDRVMAVSTVTGIKQLLQKRPVAALQHPLTRAWEAAANHDVVLGFHFARHRPLHLPKDPNPLAWMNAPLAVLTVDEGRQGQRELAVSLLMMTPSQEHASAAQKAKENASASMKPMLLDWQSEVAGNDVIFRYRAAGNNVQAVDAEWTTLADIARMQPLVEVK